MTVMGYYVLYRGYKLKNKVAEKGISYICTNKLKYLVLRRNFRFLEVFYKKSALLSFVEQLPDENYEVLLLRQSGEVVIDPQGSSPPGCYTNRRLQLFAKRVTIMSSKYDIYDQDLRNTLLIKEETDAQFRRTIIFRLSQEFRDHITAHYAIWSFLVIHGQPFTISIFQSGYDINCDWGFEIHPDLEDAEIKIEVKDRAEFLASIIFTGLRE